MQSRICVTVVGENQEDNEVALLRINNFREEHPAAAKDAKDVKQISKAASLLDTKKSEDHA